MSMTIMVLALIAIQAWTLWELAKTRQKLAKAEQILEKVTDFAEQDIRLFR